MRLHGRLLDADGARLTFAADLAANLDAADATAERIKDTIDRWILGQDIQAPEEARYQPVWHPPYDGGEPLDLDADRVRTIVWATGFVSDWAWVKLPMFDEAGRPEHLRGVTNVEGLSVLGLPWLHTWGSGRFAGIAEDAEHVAEHIAASVVPAARASAA
jgi:putative flavoprotein involved in K+ transport